MRIRIALLAFCLVCSSVPAAAQRHSWSESAPRLIISQKAVADALALEQPVMRERRDSVKDGAVIGAIIGAAALGGFVGWLCHAVQEPGNPSCVPPTLLYTGVGAGIGAAAGAGIDTLFARQPTHFPTVNRPER